MGTRLQFYGNLKIFPIFPNVLASYILTWVTCSATCSATPIHQFITNNHASFYMWAKENLFNQKVSKYYEHDCSHNGCKFTSYKYPELTSHSNEHLINKQKKSLVKKVITKFLALILNLKQLF